MKNKGIILICDHDDDHLNEVRNALENEGFSIDVLNDASELIPRAIRSRPGVIVVNPEMQAFNEEDVCKNIITDMDVPAIIMIDKNATSRASIGDCTVQHVLTKPVNISNLLYVISQQLTINQ